MYEFFNLGDYRTIIVRIREIKDKGKGKHKAREGGDIINLSHRGGIRNYRSYIFNVRWQLSSRIPAPYQTRFGSFSTNTDCWHLNDRRSCIIERDWEVTGSQMTKQELTSFCLNSPEIERDSFFHSSIFVSFSIIFDVFKRPSTRFVLDSGK